MSDEICCNLPSSLNPDYWMKNRKITHDYFKFKLMKNMVFCFLFQIEIPLGFCVSHTRWGEEIPCYPIKPLEMISWMSFNGMMYIKSYCCTHSWNFMAVNRMWFFIIFILHLRAITNLGNSEFIDTMLNQMECSGWIRGKYKGFSSTFSSITLRFRCDQRWVFTSASSK